ncbi:galactose mutarotase isoform X1 [Amia ocellicauda]|uniref:galactose mutarotase isoform X1 n=1 Tax=Amia ocellicauda TaxID=2972642 RepID=UPI0034646FC2
MTQVTKEQFGTIPQKGSVEKFILKSDDVVVEIISLGCIITALKTKDKRGQFDDIVLGFDNLEGYCFGNSRYFGAVVGRVANRIAKGKFSVDGKEYQLGINNGPNALHGGLEGFDKIADIRRLFNTPPSSPITLKPPTDQASFSSFSPLSDAEVSALLLHHKPTTCALDPLPSRLFQATAPDLLPFISSVLNSSLLSGCFPSAFKQAAVIPLLKKPTLDASSPQNYHPVSLLPFLSKTLKQVVHHQLSDFLSQHSLLDPLQSGFRTAHSTETALLAVTDSLSCARAASLSSVLILLDLSAAFDTVDHSILLSCLTDLGISGTALTWFSSYLSDRSYQVTWRGSSPHPPPTSPHRRTPSLCPGPAPFLSLHSLPGPPHRIQWFLLPLLR